MQAYHAHVTAGFTVVCETWPFMDDGITEIRLLRFVKWQVLLEMRVLRNFFACLKDDVALVLYCQPNEPLSGANTKAPPFCCVCLRAACCTNTTRVTIPLP